MNMNAFLPSLFLFFFGEKTWSKGKLMKSCLVRARFSDKGWSLRWYKAIEQMTEQELVDVAIVIYAFRETERNPS